MSDIKRLTDGLKKAIQAEIEGYHFYMMAAQNTSDAKGKEVFQMLAGEEQVHANFLRAQFKSFTDSGKADSSAKLGKPNILDSGSPVFSDSLKSRIGSAHYEMTALSIGIQLELNAVKFYRAEMEASNDDAVKAFYRDLMEWEQGHYKALLKQHDSLKEDFWNEANFAPF